LMVEGWGEKPCAASLASANLRTHGNLPERDGRTQAGFKRRTPTLDHAIT